MPVPMGITSSYQVNDLSFDEALKKMQSELRDVARRETNSKLRMRDFDGLSAFLPVQIINELKTRCPVTYKILSEMMELDIFTEKKIPPLTLVYAIIMFKLEVTIAREVLPCKQLLFYSQKNHIAQLNEFILFENIEITTGYYKYYLL